MLNSLKSSLDIQTIIRHQVDMKLLLRRIFSPEQQMMFKLQKDRIPHTDTPNSYTEKVDDYEVRSARDEKSLAQLHAMLKSFNFTTDLDKKLLIGVINRDECHEKRAKHRPKVSFYCGVQNFDSNHDIVLTAVSQDDLTGS